VNTGQDRTVSQERTTGQELLRQLVLLLANLTVITSLLVYFGWKRAEVQAEALGIDENIFDVTTMGYVVRSVDQVLYLLAGVAILGLAWLWADRRLATIMTRTWAWFVPWLAIAVGALLLIPAILFYLLRFEIVTAWMFVLTPAGAGTGILLMLYSGRLWTIRQGTKTKTSDLSQILVFLLVSATLFLTATHLAIVFGRSLAADYESYVRVPITVTSDKPLPLDGSPVVMVDGRYQYQHLLLFERIGNKVYIVKSGWRPHQGKVMVITEGEGIQFSYGN